MLTRELLIFDLAPKLTVVGGFHALNDEDKLILEQLVDRSDFVALESDQFRAGLREDPIISIDAILRNDAKVYHEKENVFNVSLVDYYYLRMFRRLNQLSIRRANILSTRTGERDTSYDELEYCYDLCQKEKKRCHLVDVPVYAIEERLAQLPMATKVGHLLSYLLPSGRPKPVAQILCQEREKYMLEQIVKNEGDLNQLQSQGLFVVGRTHALNYQKNPNYLRAVPHPLHT